MEHILQIERELNDIRATQAAAEEQHRTIFRRLDQQDKLIESVNNLATSNKLLAEEQKRQGKRIDGLCDDVEEIKAKPAKRWDTLVATIITALVSAVAGFILAKLGL